MFDSEYLDRLGAKMRQAEKESQHRRAVAREAEPLLSGLPKTGTRRFPPLQFKALVQYLLEGDRSQIARALQRGRFKLSALEFIRDGAGAGDMATVSEFARTHGVLQTTLHARVVKAGLNFVQIGNRKMFEIEELVKLLAKV